MTLFIISEAYYLDTSWHTGIINCLTDQKIKKRYNIVVLNNAEDIAKYKVNDEDILIISSTNSQCVYSYIDALGVFFENRIIVVGNRARGYENKNYSLVTSDIPFQIEKLINYFKYYGRTTIALYGYNPLSTSDKYRKSSFCYHGYTEKDIYENNGSLEECFKNFHKNINEYDAVICVNDYAAISLIKNLTKHETASLLIASCGNLSIAKSFEYDISGFEFNYENFSDSILAVQKILQKNSEALSVDIAVKSTFVPRASTKYLPMKDIDDKPAIPITSDPFYQDPEVIEMLKVENLLNSCDEGSKRILSGILNDKPYSVLADELFMSVSGIKYRLKNMYAICNVTTKKEFTELISKYISKEKLL